MENVCCEKAIESHSVYWNPYNNVIQCHSCGHIYLPMQIGVDLAKGNDWTVVNGEKLENH